MGDASRAELALRFVGGLFWYWYAIGQFREARQLVDRALVAFVAGQDGRTLRTAVDLLTDALLSHLAYEERELVEPIARLGIG